MKSLILSCLMALGTATMATANTPLDAVLKLISNANRGVVSGIDLEAAKLTEAEVLNQLQDVDLKKAHFVDWSKGKQIHWQQDPKDPNLFTVRMANPGCRGFVVRFFSDETRKGEGTYLVVGITN